MKKQMYALLKEWEKNKQQINKVAKIIRLIADGTLEFPDRCEFYSHVIAEVIIPYAKAKRMSKEVITEFTSPCDEAVLNRTDNTINRVVRIIQCEKRIPYKLIN